MLIDAPLFENLGVLCHKALEVDSCYSRIVTNNNTCYMYLSGP